MTKRIYLRVHETGIRPTCALPDAEFEAILTRAAQEGAKRALADLGLEGKGVREIIWSGELPDAYYDEFVFRARVTDRVPAGELLYIPAIQECANGAERWIEIPAKGQDSHDLEGPAPGVMVVAARGDFNEGGKVAGSFPTALINKLTI